MAINYDLLINKAMRGLIRELLIDASFYGTPHPHQFIISFPRNYPGVKIEPPDAARPGDIVNLCIQNSEPSSGAGEYECGGLSVTENSFSITDPHSCITVPFVAITNFYDPSVPFSFAFYPEPPPMAEVIPFKGTA